MAGDWPTETQVTLHNFIVETSINKNKIIEEQIRLVLKPKPDFLTQEEWEQLIYGLIEIQFLPVHF